MNTPPPPPGFAPLQVPSPNSFNNLIGPFYEKREGLALSMGLWIEPRHCNSRGICHGGLLSTLADVALGYAALAAGQARHGSSTFVTVNLSLDFAGSAKAGDWVQSEAVVQRAGSRLAFVNGYLLCNGERIVRASAVFALGGGPARPPQA